MRLLPRRASGFTIIEMMVVVLILGILGLFAFPAMTQLLRTQKVRSISYDIFADLTYTRNEAISRGRNVGIGSNSGNDWSQGWSVRDLVSGTVLRQAGAQASGITFTADSPGVIFDRTGRNTTGNVSFTIQPVGSAPDEQKRCIRISPSGRPNTTNGPCP